MQVAMDSSDAERVVDTIVEDDVASSDAQVMADVSAVILRTVVDIAGATRVVAAITRN